MPHTAEPVLRALCLTALAAAAPFARAGSWECAEGCLHTRLAPDHSPDDEDRLTELWWNATTGSDRRNYEPDRRADFTRMRLELDIPDMNTPRLSAAQTLSFKPVGAPLEALTLDAVQLTIDLVQWPGGRRGPGSVAWTHDGERLQLRFDPPLRPGEERAIEVRYTLEDPSDGLFWTPESPAWPGRPAQIHTQGEPQTSSFWFPCADAPNDRLETELAVTVPAPYVVSANGQLVAEEFSAGRTTFTWVQKPAHAPYLVSLCVGQWDIVDVGRGELDMPVYVPPGRGKDVERTYGRTLDMVRVFEKRFGVKYPWSRYAQVVVWNFGAGGMENTSATTLFDTAIYDEKALRDGDLDGLISHELGHQWFGDLLTCRTWGDIWLNEGFATYAEALWFEERDGFDHGYLWDMRSNVRGAANRDRLDPKDARAGLRPAMSSTVYRSPDDVFGRSANPYPKGASVLHMLRIMLGDDVFFRGLQAYTRGCAGTAVRTQDFRDAMEAASGRSLERFFDQWVKRPGTPEVTVRTWWDASRNELAIAVEQTQRIALDTPAFVFDLPIVIESAGATQEVVIGVTGRRHERTVRLDSEPTMVCIDPRMAVLMTPTLETPAAWLVRQAQCGPTLPARMDAAQALRTRPGRATTDALGALARSPDEHFALRVLSIESLGELREMETLVQLAQDVQDDARVRTAVMKALRSAGDSGGERARIALRVLAPVAASKEESYATRAEAIRALGALGSAADLPTLRTALTVESQHDSVRQAAVEAIADLGEAEALPDLLKLTAHGRFSRTRPIAANAAARLAADLPENEKRAAFEVLAPLLYDSESRTRAGAQSALVSLRHDQGVQELKRMSRTWRHPDERHKAGQAADRLAAAIAGRGSDESMRGELNRLRRDVEDLKAQREKSN